MLLRLLAAASLVRLWLLRGAGDSQIGLSLNMEKKLFSFTQQEAYRRPLSLGGESIGGGRPPAPGAAAALPSQRRGDAEEAQNTPPTRRIYIDIIS